MVWKIGRGYDQSVDLESAVLNPTGAPVNGVAPVSADPWLAFASQMACLSKPPYDPNQLITYATIWRHARSDAVR